MQWLVSVLLAETAEVDSTSTTARLRKVGLVMTVIGNAKTWKREMERMVRRKRSLVGCDPTYSVFCEVYRKTLGAGTRTNNKLNPHLTPRPGIKPGPHWWEVSALTTAPSLLMFMSYSRVITTHAHELLMSNYCLCSYATYVECREH